MRRAIGRERRRAAAILVIALAGPAGPGLADGGPAAEIAPGCGPEAFSFVEVDPPERRPRGAPIVALPGTLCAEVPDPTRREIPIHVQIDPFRPREPAPAPR